MKILGIDTANPRYNPRIPYFEYVFFKQSLSPVNYLCEASFPRSTPSLVLAKSRGWTNTVVAAPAKPPLNTLTKRYFILSYFVCFPTTNRLLKYYLNEKPNAWVGKYLTTLTQLPLQRANTPSSLRHLIKQSNEPLYGRVTLEFSRCVCIRSLTLSIGATTVFDIIPAIPPEKKSFQN